MDKGEVICPWHIEREAGWFVLRIHVRPANAAQHQARVQPIAGQGQTREGLNDRMKAQPAGRDEQEGAVGFFGDVTHDAFDLDPLAEQLAGGHARGGRLARLRNRRRTDRADAGAVYEWREHPACRGPFHNHHLAGRRLVIGIGVNDTDAR